MNINRTWWKAAFVRDLRTVAQTAVATIGTAAQAAKQRRLF